MKVLAGAVTAGVMLALSAGAAGQNGGANRAIAAQGGDISGTFLCNGTACSATMKNNDPSGSNPIQGFYVKTSPRASGLSITSSQATGANCDLQGPSASPECFLNREHYWQPGTTLSIKFTRATAIRITTAGRQDLDCDGHQIGKHDVVIGPTLNQAGYESEKCLAEAAGCAAEYAALKKAEARLAALQMAMATWSARYSAALARLRAAGATGGPPVHSAEAAVRRANAALGRTAAKLAKAQKALEAAKAAYDACLAKAGIRIGGEDLHPSCQEEGGAAAAAESQASTLAEVVQDFTAAKLGPAEKALRSGIATLTRAAKSAKGAAKAKLLRAIGNMKKADAIMAPLVRNLAALAADAKAAAVEVPKAQAALDACEAD